MINNIAHLAINTANMPDMLDFYCSRLGFRHAFSIDKEDGSKWIEYVMVSPGQFIEFFYAAPDKNECERFAHICFAVDDITKTLDRIEAAGAPVLSRVSRGKDGNYQAWTADPDGNRIELMQISPDSLQAKASAQEK